MLNKKLNIEYEIEYKLYKLNIATFGLPNNSSKQCSAVGSFTNFMQKV